jgi:ergothioneine biosynthesis protein EgtB
LFAYARFSYVNFLNLSLFLPMASSVLLPNAPAETVPTASLLPAHYQAVRAQSVALVQPLLPEDTVVQPTLDVSPPKWHLAHTTWFWETFLLTPYLPGYTVFHPDYAFLFNSYYNSLGSRVNRADRGTLSRPPLSDVYRYRAYVDEHMATLFEKLSELPATVTELLELGLHHEQQHQELLATDIKYILSTNPLAPGYLEKEALPSHHAAATSANAAFSLASWLPVPGGIYAIGHQQEGFSFDNESPVHEVLVAPFELQNRLVTNADFLRFIEAGGYQQFQFWLGEGWDLANREGWKAPLYWSQQANGQWLRYGPTGLEPLNLAAPVSHISFYEADRMRSGQAGASPLKPSGKWRLATFRRRRRAATGSKPATSTRSPYPPLPIQASAISYSATVGSGRIHPTTPTPVISAPRVPWASTTANSW